MAENNAYGIKEKILVLKEADKAALGAVRCLPGLSAVSREGKIWVRGIAVKEPADRIILQLPVLHTYLLDGQNRLFPAGGLTPVARLEELHWTPLIEFIPLELPVSVLPGMMTQKLKLRLVQTAREQKMAALMTTLEIWKDYGLTAPLVRLQRLQFAVSENDEALIIGEPLPPVPGKAYTLQDGILLPAGYAFDPPGVHASINSLLNPDSDGYLLWDVSGAWQHIPSSYCVPATRSAIRMTKGGRHGI